MILKNVFYWDCCAFPKPLNTETITIISSKCNAWSDVLPECGARDERPLFLPIRSSAPIRGEKPKCPHLSWFGCTGTYGRANQSCCNVLLMQVSLEWPVWWSRHWVLGWPPDSLTNEDGELFFFFFPWYQQLSSHVNIFAPRVRSNYALHHHWCWNQLYQSY